MIFFLPTFRPNCYTQDPLFVTKGGSVCVKELYFFFFLKKRKGSCIGGFPLGCALKTREREKKISPPDNCCCRTVSVIQEAAANVKFTFFYRSTLNNAFLMAHNRLGRRAVSSFLIRSALSNRGKKKCFQSF